MKGIKTILGVLAAATLLTVSFNASAQENANRDADGNIVRGAYETNGLWDNWFLDLGAGINTVYDSGFKGHMGLATEINLGKWITPVSGIRFGWHGLSNEPNGAWDGTAREHVAFNYFHGDYMLNISNLFSGYKETRTWDIIPYLTTGVLVTGNGDGEFKGYLSNYEYAAGAGLRNEFRLGSRWNFNVDLQWLVGSAKNYSHDGRFINFPSVLGGFSYNLSKKANFDRHDSITPVIIPLPFTEDDYNALKDKCAALEKENAALKDKIAELEAREPETKYVEVGVSSATIYFDMGQTTVSDREKAHLEYFANEVDKEKELVVVGSADLGTGSAKRNEYLANKRAEAVKALLENAGFNNVTVGDPEYDIFEPAVRSRVAVIKVK